MALAETWVADFIGNDFRITAWDHSITYDGRTFLGGKGIEIQDAVAELGAPSVRASISFEASDNPTLTKFIEDVGPDQIRIEWIYSDDLWATWQASGSEFIGLMSTPNYNDGVYTIELETYIGGIIRVEPRKWSYEQQMARTNNRDKIFEQVKQLMQPRKARWPL